MHDGLLPARARTGVEAAALRLRRNRDHVDARDLDAEERLDGLAHLRLVGILVHLEGVLAVGKTGVALLGDDRSDEYVSGVHDAFPSTSWSAASLTSTERAQTIGATSSSDGTVTSTRSRLRKDLIRPTSSSCAMTTSGVSLPHCSTSALACLVDGVSNAVPSTSASVSLPTWFERAPASAARRTLRFTLTSKLRMPGANATPPPVKCGARIVPWRARPVPFWRQGLARPPATMPRVLAPRVPARWAFSSARTTSCTMCLLSSAPNTAASSVALFAVVPPSTSAFNAAISRHS